MDGNHSSTSKQAIDFMALVTKIQFPVDKNLKKSTLWVY